MQYTGMALIVLSLLLASEAGQWVFFIGVCMVGFGLGGSFAGRRREKGGKHGIR